MHEAEELDTCRICSGPAESGQPLFHPCKCSGTIRYIHQDCLTTWLAHSKKKSCDVCKHPYSFTKVYATDMPPKLPVTLVIRRTLQQIVWGIIFVIRAFVVGTIWLAVLPLMTVWTWRLYFSMGEYTAWWISDRPQPSPEHLVPGPHRPFRANINATLSPLSSYLSLHVSDHPMWITLSSDIFTGQIIASIIVLTFVAVFLLREWIAQNARPGVFEDEELPEEPIPPPPPPPPVQRRVDEANELPEQLARRQIEAMRALEALRAAEAQHGIGRDGHRVLPHWQFAVNEPLEPPGDAGAHQQRKRPRRRNRTLPDQETLNGEVGLLNPGGERVRKKAFTRRLQAARMSGARRKLQAGGTLPLIEMELDERDAAIRRGVAEPSFGFTFKPPTETEDEVRRTSSAPDLTTTSASLNHDAIESLFPPSPAPSSSTPALPFSISAVPLPPPNYSPPRPPSFEIAINEETSTSTSQIPRRPPLPTVTLPPVDSAVQPLSTSSSTSKALGTPPLASPSLATYRAPEQITAEAGPSNLSGYFAPSTSGLGLDTNESEEDSDTPVNVEHDTVPAPIEEELDVTESEASAFDWVESMHEQRAEGDSEEEEDLELMTPQQLRAARARYFGKLGKLSNERNQVESSEASGSQSCQVETGDSGDEPPESGPVRMDGDEGTIAQDINPQRQHRQVPPEPPQAAPLQPAPQARAPVYGGVLIIGADETDDERDEDEQSEEEDEEEEQARPEGRGLHIVQPDPDGGVNIVFNPGHLIELPRPLQINRGDGQFLGPQQVVAPVGLQAGAAEAAPAPAGAGVVLPNENGIGNVADAAVNIDAALLAANEDVDVNAEDDMDGALEAIGMRGPIHGVIQNAAVMVFVLHMAIGLGIWLPFTIGKSVALLVLDPYRCLQILHLPIRAIRVITDPVVDTAVWMITHVIAPSIFHIVRRQTRTLLSIGMLFVRMIFGTTRAANVRYAVDSASQQLSSTLLGLAELPLGLRLTSPSTVTPTEPVQPHSALQSLTDFLHDHLGPAQPYFETLGREVRISSTQTRATWEQLAQGSGPKERAFAVALGYFVVAMLLAIYLNVLSVGSVKKAHKAVRSTVRQQLLVLKVAVFILIELVAFPLGCGICLDICTIWLFPQVSPFSRAAYFFQAPLTAMFYHWVAGTMFMYTFAILLSGCRSIMRPGAMWFIKDPQDQNSHPIRDILDRPALTQLRKILVSGLMYSFVVFCVVSSVAALLVLGKKSVLPFRWRTREPLSAVPIDLLFLHLVLPYTVHYLRPRKTLKAVTLSIWRALARRLRLSSYFFGGRYLVEEYPPKNFFLNFLKPADLLDQNAPRDGGLRRVPATDHIALPKDMRATAAVNELGEPIDAFNRQLIANQNAEAERTNRSVRDDYTIVYLPPGFRYRIFAFIAALWVIGALSFGVAVALPILLGRGFFRLFVSYELHDGYSIIVGFYLLWGCHLFGRAVDKLDKRRQRHGEEGPRADLRILVLKRGILWVLKITYLTLLLGFVIPTMVSFVMELYLVLPLRLLVNPSLSPRIRVVDAWALGLLYTKIALFVQRARPDGGINQGLRRIMNNGWTHPEPLTATKEVIGPMLLGLSAMIAAPAALFLVGNRFLPFLQLSSKSTFVHLYPIIFAIAAVSGMAKFFYSSLLAWSQAVRDKEFLVEMRLQNHDPETPRIDSAPETPA